MAAIIHQNTASDNPLAFLLQVTLRAIITASGTIRNRRTTTTCLVSAVMLIAFFVTACLLWDHFSGKYWNMSFGQALKAAGDSANYGHPVEHTAEVLLVNLLIFSTLISIAAGAITGTVRHLRMKRRYPAELASPA